MIGLLGLDDHGGRSLPIEDLYQLRRWWRAQARKRSKTWEECELRRVSAVEATDLSPTADWKQFHPLLRHIDAILFTELTYLVLPDGSSFAVPGGPIQPMPPGAIVTIPANSYLMRNSATEYTILPKAQFDLLWELGP